MASSSSRRWKYDVFLNFRGEDVRRTFISHLESELHRKGIITFKDDQELHPGDSISIEIFEAIKNSRFAIAVISENYAFSSWCLDELEMIMECENKGKLTVIPIFYEVDPLDVSEQRGSFAEGFKSHEGSKTVEKVQKWKETLTEAGNSVDSRTCAEEAKMIQGIVNSVSNQLFSMLPSDYSHLIGMSAHMEAIYPLLSMKSDEEVRMIGIWGMGGVGKTTIAQFLYDQFSCHFQAHCFIENVKKISAQHSLPYLQAHLLSEILHVENLKFQNLESGSSAIKSRLGHQKVLAVLDDVDEIDQLSAVAKENNWFGPGSRIIITTGDKGLLSSHGVELVYKVKCLRDEDALQLFRQFAFRGRHPLDGFQDLSICASKLAGGLPLALKVLGSFLYGRKKEQWEGALYRLERSPHKNIMELLKLSYDGLEEQDQLIFLKIACLFNGWCDRTI